MTAEPELLMMPGEREAVGTQSYEEGVYSLVAWIPDAPALALSNVGPTGPLGPVQPTGHPDLDAWLIAQSPLRDVPRDYFPSELDVSPLVAHREHDFACVIANGQLTLDHAADSLAEGEALARFLIERARVTAALGADYGSIRERFSDDALEPEDIAVVRALAEEAGAWVTLHLEREGNGLGGRPRLSGHGEPLEGELSLHWQDGDLRQLQLSLRGSLPGSGARAALRPEDPGLLGKLLRMGERVIGDAELDQAWIIRCGAGAVETLVALRAQLLALRPFEARVDLFPDLVSVECRSVFDQEDLPTVLNAALHLWDGAARHQLGER